ncbi:MAG: sugar phosphate isomerase [Candidatus Omnitrophica bacterium]|nr:sugar phosphate isomerase [Candidatus Omnitrophota bacterium]
MKKTDIAAEEKAAHFLKEETQFRLGFLPTEQPHKKTSGLDKACKADLPAGIRMLLSVDRDIPPKAAEVFASSQFKMLVSSIESSLSSEGRIIFSGCGATGRLSILLEAAWRKSFSPRNGTAERVLSIMTGGDYALIRSVESFEDYMGFGRRQAKDLGISGADTFIAVTEGGETSSVLGSAMQAADDGARVFLAFNNPAELLNRKIERSRIAITDPRITVLDLCTGPMAIAGSTRMQATTTELLILGWALQEAFNACAGNSDRTENPVAIFEKLLDGLNGDKAVEAIASMIEFEEGIYSQGGLVTYFADNLLIDILTDTTERNPTFMLPPFVKADDNVSPQSWSFVKSPLYPTEKAWERVLGRAPRCLEWTKEDYISLNASEKIAGNPPAVGSNEILKFRIGREKDERRFRVKPSAAVAVVSVSDTAQNMERFIEGFGRHKKNFSESRFLFIGEEENIPGAVTLPCRIEKSPLNLWEHLAVKLVMNTISTITMVRMGRVESNWMSWVQTSCKKLIDRATRLIAELCGISYEEACRELFKSIAEIENTESTGKENPSPVQHAIGRITAKNSS